MSETGCSRPAGGPVGQKPAEQEQHIQPEENKLSDYLGKWVALCFYPGDFTFV